VTGAAGIDFAAVNRKALAVLRGLVQEWAPGGKFEGDEYVVKNPARHDQNPGSFKINIQTGHWGDFIPGGVTGGDPISYYAYLNKLDQGEAAKCVGAKVGVEVNGHQYKGARGDSKHTWTPIPVPNNVKLPDGGHWPDGMSFPTHRDLGDPASVVWFRNSANEVVVGEFRFDVVGLDGKQDKQYRPHTYCRRDDGQFKWQWKGLPHPWPLFDLPGLLAAPSKPVLFVEGARKAEPARELFPEYAVTAMLFGAKSPHLSDFSPLRERNITIWPDHDAAGKGFANHVAALASKAGASSARVVEVPESFPAKWDLHDELPAGITVEQLAELLRSARPWEAAPVASLEQGYVSFGHYRMGDKGLFFISEKADGSVDEIWLSAPFEVLALTRDARSNSWGKLLRWCDPDSNVHEWAMGAAMLAGRDELWRYLLDQGLPITSNIANRGLLAAYLNGVEVESRAQCVSRIGWHLIQQRPVFVLPDTTFGEGGVERIIWQTNASVDSRFNISGSVDDWRGAIASKCVSNSRLVTAVSTGFAAPLLDITRDSGGGFHYRGGSQTGKTTLGHVAGSVWGGDSSGVNGYLRSWRATANGLEGIAAAHSDSLLVLDEIGQIEAREAGESAYMLSNGSGKGRAARDGSARTSAQWRLLFISTGEVSLADKMAEIGRRAHAGQEVRLVDIPADAGKGLGIFENFHGASSPSRFAEELRRAAFCYYGSPIREFLRILTDIYAKDPGGLVERLQGSREGFLKAVNLPEGSSAQVRSVCNRFALVAAGGSLATVFGITGWSDDEADRAAAECFRAWLDQRGNAGDIEIESAIRQVIVFIEQHGNSRFESAWDSSEERIINRAGFRRRITEKQQIVSAPSGEIITIEVTVNWEYMVLPEVWRSEVLNGFDVARTTKEMVRRGLIIPSKDTSSSTVKVPKHGVTRVYALSPEIISGNGVAGNSGNR
jgi:putative DNA primase/helicase